MLQVKLKVVLNQIMVISKLCLKSKRSVFLAICEIIVLTLVPMNAVLLLSLVIILPP